jgi:hypothetical protein
MWLRPSILQGDERHQTLMPAQKIREILITPLQPDLKTKRTASGLLAV